MELTDEEIQALKDMVSEYTGAKAKFEHTQKVDEWKGKFGDRLSQYEDYMKSRPDYNDLYSDSYDEYSQNFNYMTEEEYVDKLEEAIKAAKEKDIERAKALIESVKNDIETKVEEEAPAEADGEVATDNGEVPAPAPENAPIDQENVVTSDEEAKVEPVAEEKPEADVEVTVESEPVAEAETKEEEEPTEEEKIAAIVAAYKVDEDEDKAIDALVELGKSEDEAEDILDGMTEVKDGEDVEKEPSKIDEYFSRWR